MKKFKKLIWLIIAIGIVVAGFFALRGKKTGPEYVTEPVARATLSQTVEATGKVASAERIGLNFRTAGRVATMNVDVGDTVRAGQLLAQLDATAFSSKVTDARARIAQEQADYEKLLAGATEEDIQIARDTVTQKELALISARNSIGTIASTRDTQLKNFKEAALNTLRSEIVVAKAAIEEINNTLNDPDAQQTISVTNRNALKTAKESRDTANTRISEVEGRVDELSVDSEDNSVIGELDAETDMLEMVISALDDALTVLNHTITSVDLTESKLDTLKNNIQTRQTTINASKVSVQTAKSNWTNKIVFYEEELANARDAVDAAEAAVQTAQSQLLSTQSPPRQFELNAQQARVQQAQAALQLALANLGDATIRAPLDGTITKKHYEAGEQTSLASPVLEMIGKATLEIEVDIPESDVAKVIVGQPVRITLDAFGDDTEFAGVVSFVDPAETLIQDVVYYKVKVAFSDSGRVKPGMTANVTIVIDTKDDVLSVPNRAVKSRNGDKYVEVLENGMPAEHTVILGLRGDEGIEILSGVSEGDNVITFVKE